MNTLTKCITYGLTFISKGDQNVRRRKVKHRLHLNFEIIGIIRNSLGSDFHNIDPEYLTVNVLIEEEWELPAGVTSEGGIDLSGGAMGV